MENATKALLMGGAILIAILLISIGVLLFQSTDDIRGEANTSMSTAAVGAFNTKFTPYIGKGKSAEQTKALISLINANNANSSHNVKMVDINSASDISSSFKYDVLEKYDINGYITEISIQKSGAAVVPANRI